MGAGGFRDSGKGAALGSVRRRGGWHRGRRQGLAVGAGAASVARPADFSSPCAARGEQPQLRHPLNLFGLGLAAVKTIQKAPMAMS